EEWLTFHQGIGVTHFFLYNNFSTDPFREVLAPWIARGLVSLFDWPVPTGQVAAYRHCVRRAWSDCRWIAFIDIDEFLYSPTRVDIRPILAGYADLPGLEIWQLFFGANGHQRRPARPVIESYTRRAPLRQTTVKTIANPRFIYKVGVHQCKYLCGSGL